MNSHRFSTWNVLWLLRTVLPAIVAAVPPCCDTAGAQPPAPPPPAPSATDPSRAAQLAERDRLWGEAQKLRADGKLSEALAAGRKMLAIEREVLRADSEDLPVSLNWLAEVAAAAEDWKQAEAFHTQALAWSTQQRGAKHWKSVDARLALERVRKWKSLTTAARADLVHAYRLNGEVLQLIGAGKFSDAVPKAEQLRDISKQVLGERHPDYATSLNNLALLYDSMGDYARAEPFYVEARAIYMEVLGDKHPLYATSLNNLAALYESMGDYERAEPFYIQSRDIRKQVLGERHLDYATSLNNLALLYSKIGDYVHAEPLLVEARAIRKEVLGIKHPNYATSLNNLAQLYRNTGDYARAEPLYVQSRDIRKQVLGERHPDYATSLNNLALLYDSMGDYARAEPLYVQSRDIRKQVLGERHPDYATSLNNLAALYSSMGDYARAEPLYIEALAIRKDVVGVKHRSFAISLNNLAGIYFNMGDYARAKPLYIESLRMFKQALGEQHPDYALSLSNLAILCVHMGDHAKAERLYREALLISRSSLEATALVQSERQQLSMGQSLRHRLDDYVSLGANTDKYARNVFAQVLTWKGATLVRQRGMRLAADDPAVKELFTRLQRTATQLASLSRAVPGKEDEQAAWRTKLSELTHEKERLEAELSAKSAVFRRATKEVTLDDLLASLPKDAVLVDYLEFNRSTPPKNKGDRTKHERQLVAFVVRHAEKPEDQVTLIPLGTSAPLSASIDAWRTTFGMDPAGAGAGKALRAAVWQPLVEHFGGAKTILVSTDGVLGRLPLGALPGKEPGTYLLEDHRLAVIPVPQLLPTLVNAEGKRTLSKELLLLGDVDYDAAPGADVAPKKKQPRRPGETRTPTDAKLFDPLAGAAGEIAAVKDLYGRLFEVKSDDPRSLVQAQADEARFRSLAPQYRHLHLATHGFFAENRFQSSESSAAAALAAQRKLFAPTAQAADAPPPAPLVGIGAQLQTIDGKLLVQMIVAGGAAAADGRLKPGDEIRKVGPAAGELVDVAGKPLNDAVALIRGEAGTKVRVEVVPKDGKEPVVYELTRKVIPQAGVAATQTPTTSASSASAPVEVVGYNPGLLSGLALTGANLDPSSREDDGILTAQEIGVMDLSGVDTVVLSACDTGLGETAGGEGLLGVQRAFQTAGARTTVASFWKVDDLVTRFLMERFYRNLWEKDMSRLDALREAQLHVLKHPEEVRGGDALPNQDKAKARTSPRYWAAFALSGEWR